MTDEDTPAAAPGPGQSGAREVFLGPGLPVLLIGGGSTTGTYPHGVVMVRDLHGGIHHHVPTPPVPRQQLPDLPPPPGHDDVRRALADLVVPGSATATLAVISGPALTGAALASEILRATDAPGGHRYVNLAASTECPLAPEAALAELLAAVGADGAQSGVAEMSAHWRTATATRPVALLVDDAVSAAQVRPLLPSGASVTVVTSSYPLTGLVMDGARLLVLEPPGEDSGAGRNDS